MKTNSRVLKALMMISQIGVSMMVPIFLCVFIGIKLDEWLGTVCFVIIFMFLGVLAAFRNVYIMTKSFYAKDKAKEDKKLEYLAELKNNKNKQ